MDFIKPNLAETLKTLVDNNSEADNPPKFSWRVKPSSLGDECVARQWFAWRWVYRKQVPGRIARLFKRGHNREANFTAMLRRAGWEIRDYEKRLVMRSGDGRYFAQDWEEAIAPGYEDVHQDPWHIAECHQQDKWLLRQWGMKDFNGHMTGYFDGKGRHPELTQNQWGIVEYKTYNTKRFSVLQNKGGVKPNDYGYYVQVCLYMKYHDLPFTLFFAENKNDDDIYFEVFPRDDAVADDKLKTAHTIITSPVRPARYAENGAHHVCKVCDYVGVCHHGQPVAINCRSCTHCEATDNGKFKCNKWGAVIPGEKEMLAACPSHNPVI